MSRYSTLRNSVRVLTNHDISFWIPSNVSRHSSFYVYNRHLNRPLHETSLQRMVSATKDAAIPSPILQTRSFTSASSGRDMGARVRALQQRRMWGIAAGGTLVAGFVILVLNTFQENLMFYITPTQAIEKFVSEPGKSRFRLGGLVLEGSVRHFSNSTEMEFVVTDLANEILVKYRGALPDLFREGHSVVAEGFLKPWTPETPDHSSDPSAAVSQKAKQLGCFFAASEVLAKHDEKYMPKEVAAAVERNKSALAAEQATKSSESEVELKPILSKQKASKLSKVAQSPSQPQDYEIGS